MQLLRLLFALALVAFFIVKAGKHRIYLLGVPFLMFMADSVFFRSVRIFWVPARLSYQSLLMIWLFVVWLVSTDLPLARTAPGVRLRRPFGPALVAPAEWAMVAVAVLLVTGVTVTAARFQGVGSSIFQASGLIYLVLGYLLVRGCAAQASREEMLSFLRALVWVNTLAAGLFILHQGLHFPVYVAEEYQQLTFQGQLLSRSFYFMPQLLPLAIAYCFARERWTAETVVVFLISLLAIWVSYTRALLLAVVVIGLVVFGMRLVKGKEGGVVMRRLMAMAAALAIVVVLVLSVMPVQSRYFFTRISSAVAGRGVGDQNVQVRLKDLQMTYRWAVASDPVLGAGFISSQQDPRVAAVESSAPDDVWVPILYRLGLAGVVAFALAFVLYAIQALRVVWRAPLKDEVLPLMLVGALAGMLAQGFFGWIFMDPWQQPMGLWLFAFIAVEAARARRSAQAVPVVLGA